MAVRGIVTQVKTEQFCLPGSIWLGSVPLVSVPLGSVCLGSVPLGSVLLGSVCLGSSHSTLGTWPHLRPQGHLDAYSKVSQTVRNLKRILDSLLASSLTPNQCPHPTNSVPDGPLRSISNSLHSYPFPCLCFILPLCLVSHILPHRDLQQCSQPTLN